MIKIQKNSHQACVSCPARALLTAVRLVISESTRRLKVLVAATASVVPLVRKIADNCNPQHDHVQHPRPGVRTPEMSVHSGRACKLLVAHRARAMGGGRMEAALNVDGGQVRIHLVYQSRLPKTLARLGRRRYRPAPAAGLHALELAGDIAQHPPPNFTPAELSEHIGSSETLAL